MDEASRVETCRFARPTIRVPYPAWTEAEDKPWTCLRDVGPRPIVDTDVCVGCPRWEGRRLRPGAESPAS